MTHSLHRVLPGSLSGRDFVLLLTPAQRTLETRAALDTLLLDVLEQGPVNIGSYSSGTLMEGEDHLADLRRAILQDGRLRCCFSSPEAMTAVLRKLKERDLGISVVVSGDQEQVQALGHATGLRPHTINCSCGVHGRTEDLPPDDVRAFTSQCGHGMVPPRLLARVQEELQQGIIQLDEAVSKLARPCVCGIFNLDATRTLLEQRLRRPRDQRSTKGR